MRTALVAAALVAAASACGDGEPGRRGPAGTPLFRGSSPAAFAGLPDHPRASASSAFWEWWGDGRAELSGYRVRTQRYGAPREAEVVLIYVTEPHDRRTWIKDDDAPEPHRVEVLKLNVAREFRTGIYPYSVLTSVFAPVDDWGRERFSPVKLTATAHEWCGSWSAAVWPGPRAYRALRLSYFAREGETREERRAPAGTLYEDALLIQLRELDGPFAGGGDWEGSLVPSLWAARRGHRDLAPVAASIARADDAWPPEEGAGVRTPATRFVLRAGDRARTYWVEREAPRRVLEWTIEEGGRIVERAEILRTERLAYWRLNRPGDEGRRRALGLGPASIPGAGEPEGGTAGAGEPGGGC